MVKREWRSRRPEWSKVMALLVILAGFIIVQECLVLMYLCIKYGYEATAAWLTAGVGVGEAMIIAGANAYFSLCKVDHKRGGITFEAAKADNFGVKQPTDRSDAADLFGSVDSPAI